MKRLRNQHDRLPRWQANQLKHLVGNCPHCARFENNAGVEHGSVIYRFSETSVTFRCERCKLQWTITLANMHRTFAEVARCLKEAGATKEAEVYNWWANDFKFAVEREQTRKSSIQRLLQNPRTRRHVIRLPDTARP